MSRGTIKSINQEIEALTMTGIPHLVSKAIDLGILKSNLLINGGVAPIPARVFNQRQRRKRTAQMR